MVHVLIVCYLVHTFKEPAYTSELVMWATKQTESFAVLIKRHALASSAAAGGLRAAAECVQIALGHCSLLEARGLAICPVLLKLFRPSVEQAVDANLKRIEESTAAMAAADDWVLTHSPTTTRQSGRAVASLGTASAFQHKLTSSAHRFNLMVQDFFEDVTPLLSMLGGQTLTGVIQVFNSYMNMLIKALPGSMEEEGNFEGFVNKIVRMAETEEQQIALLANASLLADELLPRAAMKLYPPGHTNYKDDRSRRHADKPNRHPEQREWRKRLVTAVDRLKDTFCRQHALDLIFTEDGDSYLSAEMYINMDSSNVEEIEWFPSPIFQELFLKLSRMASITAEMFVGRERFATLLLMRLTETVILWLSEDQSFWDDIEEGPRPLGPMGLQQFYLDMKFVLCFATQGRYLSRNLHRVVNEIINKGMAAFSATGMDPDRVLPEDEWFNEVCQEAIERLSGKPKAIDGEREVNSPTASVSAQSMSSVRSHGSS
ncbi:Exocyst complex component EXO84B [Linum grandiflorum]